MSLIRSRRKLTWAPPVLTNPTRIEIKPGVQTLSLDRRRDYELYSIGSLTDPGGVRIIGGRNVTWVGGHIIVPALFEEPLSRRGLYLKGQTGTIHVEGLKIEGNDISDAINLDERLGATVQLQNIETGTVRGSRDGWHADILQSWAGPKTLRIDGFKGSSNYQGFFLKAFEKVKGLEVEGWDIRNVELEGSVGSAYLFWTDVQGVNVENVNLHGSQRKNVVWNAKTLPTISSQAPEKSVLIGKPGLSYQSPGYSR